MSYRQIGNPSPSRTPGPFNGHSRCRRQARSFAERTWVRNGGRYLVKFRSAIKRRHWRRSESASGTHRPHYLSFILYVGESTRFGCWMTGADDCLAAQKTQGGDVCVCTLQGFKRSPITGQRWSDSALSAGQQWCQVAPKSKPSLKQKETWIIDRRHSSFTRHVRVTIAVEL